MQHPDLENPQFLSLQIRRATFPKYLNFAYWQISRLSNCERLGRDTQQRYARKRGERDCREQQLPISIRENFWHTWISLSPFHANKQWSNPWATRPRNSQNPFNAAVYVSSIMYRIVKKKGKSARETFYTRKLQNFGTRPNTSHFKDLHKIFPSSI